MKVRSDSSAKRLSIRLNPKSFYSSVPVAAGPNDDDDDEDDSTYEGSETEEESEFTEECSMEIAAEQQEEDIPNLQKDPVMLDHNEEDGASDYHPSDEGEGDEVQPQIQGPEKFKARAKMLLSYMGLDIPFWVVKMAKFSRSENRWVNKGPVVVYFVNEKAPRLQGNYLYGTKTLCIDMKSSAR